MQAFFKSAYVTSAIVPLTETSHMVKLAVSVGGYYSKGMDTEEGIIIAIFVKNSILIALLY